MLGRQFETDSMRAMRKRIWLSLGLGAATLAGTSYIILNSAIFNPAIAQTAVALARNFRPDPVKLQGRTGGSVSMTSLSGQANCRGFASEQPNHTINLTANFPLVDFLVYTKNVNDDTTMMIKGPNGLVMCADDEYRGRNPQLTRRLPEGSYQIWVGARNANQSVNYTLSVSEIKQK
ncbi:hypothetical protein [Pseudanabaena sp. PCC 6802]|uniref:hypothetical protein n=1 Tax=Pseudanabaena sp. PCC 6802 TaxID=118173 RepID=UPI0012EA4042|nr:hypothetical protein [Pseudanabaena sp. PCC 6802]